MKKVFLLLAVFLSLGLILGCTSAITPEAVFGITYDGNGADSGSVPVDNAEYVLGFAAEVAGNTGGLAKTGYYFAGWNSAADGTGNGYSAGAALPIGSANITLYAVWVLPGATFTITYNGNGNTGGLVPTDADNYLAGSTAALATNSGSLVKTGSYFVGWNTAANGSGTSYLPGAAFVLGSSNVTLYAAWTSTTDPGATFSITYDSNGADSGSVPIDTATYHQYNAVTVTSGQGTLVKAGYNLAGWMTAQDGTGTSYAPGTVFSMKASNTTLYAVWISTDYSFRSEGTAIILSRLKTNLSGAISVPAGITDIGELIYDSSSDYTAFQNYSLITSILLPQSIQRIGLYAFYGCTGLTSITIPAAVTSIGSAAFYGCTGLTSITIPAAVTIIGSSAFSGCTGLTSITIPAAVTSIAVYTFAGCTGLTSITIQAAVTSIGSAAFSGCTALSSITIPAAVTSIGNSVFNGCALLATVTIMPTTPPTLGLTAFTGLPGGYQLKVPVGTVGTYQAATNWSTWAANIVSQ